jgi:hypothetical protein
MEAYVNENAAASTKVVEAAATLSRRLTPPPPTTSLRLHPTIRMPREQWHFVCEGIRLDKNGIKLNTLFLTKIIVTGGESEVDGNGHGFTGGKNEASERGNRIE